MRFRVSAIVGLVIGLGVVNAQVEFKQYASGEGRYKVIFPGPVKSESFDVKMDKNNLKLTIDSVELRAGTVFLVSYVDAPEDVAKSPPGPRFDKIRDANKGAAGKVHQEKDLTVGLEKLPARDVLIEMPTGFMRNRIVIAGRRIYQVMVQGSKDVVTSPSADRFMDSFEVTK
jgi:hypothetical protein